MPLGRRLSMQIIFLNKLTDSLNFLNECAIKRIDLEDLFDYFDKMVFA